MRSLVGLLGLTCFMAMGIGASAEEIYLTATGDRVSALDVFQDCDDCPEMIVLPLGQFQMGSSVGEALAAERRFFANQNVDPASYEEKLRQALIDLGIDPDHPEEALLKYYASGHVNRHEDPQYSVNPMLHEVPVHQVSIDLPIAMGRNEVTREEWAACVEDGGCEQGQRDIPVYDYVACERTSGCVPTPDARVAFRHQQNPPKTHPRGPRVGVTFYEAMEYAAWLNKKIGANVYRVPTEAEWEYAARSETTTRFAQGDTLTLDQANYLVARRDIVDGEYVWEHDLGSAHDLLPVDLLDAANDWGLRHMSGNASEFTSTCGDGPHRGLTSSSAYIAADSDRTDCKRSVKGGSYNGNVELARPARRVPLPSDHWSPSVGFRVVRDLTPVSDSWN
ncbi:MAG: formylglycine-generating enzyme family protein [Albidovulum sp.]|uniref:formylglycine-generating enzyme family protein n=1 Tax=Albidovulum sp. TaxID=1872424 RepID=UPI003CAF5976